MKTKPIAIAAIVIAAFHYIAQAISWACASPHVLVVFGAICLILTVCVGAVVGLAELTPNPFKVEDEDPKQ